METWTNSTSAMVITDNGEGKLLHGNKLIGGRVDYATGEVHIPNTALLREVVEPQYENYQVAKGTGIISFLRSHRSSIDNMYISAAQATVSTIDSADVREISETVDSGCLKYNLLADKPYPNAVLLNTWVFEIGGTRTIERDGVLYQNWRAQDGAGDVVGYLNVSGELTLNKIAPNQAPAVKILQGVWVNGDYQVQQFHGRTALAPVKPQSFTAYADFGSTNLEGKAQADETLSGSLKGKIDSKTGYFEIQADRPIPPESLRYNAVSQSVIPLDSTIIGINAVRLPMDGKVPIFRKGDMIVIHNTLTQDLGSAHSAGQTIKLTRQMLDRICVVDADNTHINAELYDYDLDAGELQWATPLDLSAYKQPLTAHLVWEEENRIMDTNISGSLKLQFPISRDYPIENTYVSSAILGGDLLVRVTEPFTQSAWTNVWQDTRVGDPLLARLNVKDFPIKLTSDGAISERWLLKFTSPTQFECYGEHIGLVAEGDTLTDFAPPNPATGKPYFTIPQAAFGGGFAKQNCVRFNTDGTPMPVWVLRAIQPSAQRKSQRDGFGICLRGNTNMID